MARELERYIKVYCTFPRHPKTLALSDKAFRHLICAWVECRDQGNDGRLTNHQVSTLFSKKTRDELVAVGYLIETENGYLMHDYTEAQPTAADLADLHRRRAEAGRRGGRAAQAARANREQLLEQTSSNPSSKIEAEREREQLLSLKQTKTSGGGETQATRASARPARGTRLPPDWQPAPELVRFVLTECTAIDGRTETEGFKEYWLAKAGKDATKLDWQLTYKRWMRKQNAEALERKARRFTAGLPASSPAANGATIRRQESLETLQRLADMSNGSPFSPGASA